jgi:hypothetical protein
MVAKCPMRVFDMYLEKDGTTTTICGPYWRSLVRLYAIQLGDVVSFTYMEEENRFHLNVYQIVNTDKVEKPYVREQGMIQYSQTYQIVNTDKVLIFILTCFFALHQLFMMSSQESGCNSTRQYSQTSEPSLRSIWLPLPLA